MRRMLTVFFLPFQSQFNMEEIIVSVKQLNTYVKSLIESDVHLCSISVTGEISNFKNHYSSGHWYFTLKDGEAQIRCVMFSSYASHVMFDVSDGMSVVVKGRVSIYERDGQYQLYAEELHADGEGDLAVAFNRLKDKLSKEGLFDSDQKRPLKRFPQRIAVLTSDTGAAVQDILNITAKRYPVCDILLCPVAVQGESAAKSMTDMLEKVYERDDVDTIIIGRGGGSLEDLWAFNDEGLARKIYESPIPVISAVGHETDFTICDFVADVRASTPSHAAELAVPDIRVLLDTVFSYKNRLQKSLFSKYEIARSTYQLVISKSVLSSPKTYFDILSLKVDELNGKLIDLIKLRIAENENRYSSIVSKLDALSPLKTLSRGFAAVSDDTGSVKSINQLFLGHQINLRFSDGTAQCDVSGIKGVSYE